MEQILQPNRDRGVPYQNKSFYGGRSFEPGTQNSLAKPFAMIRSFLSKPFATREFAGSKNYWTGEYQTKEASASSRAGFFARNKKYPVKKVETKTVWDSDKQYDTRDYETRSAQIRGTAQGSIDAEEAAKAKKLSIDEVRELLNKNK